MPIIQAVGSFLGSGLKAAGDLFKTGDIGQYFNTAGSTYKQLGEDLGIVT